MRALSLLVVALLVYARDPSLFRSPRFWAEEGTNYFGSAITHGFLDGLSNLQAAPYNPYLHLVPHLATLVAAHLVPLTYAPLVTTFAWAAVLLAYELVALFGRAELLRAPWRRALAVATPLLAISDSENWANTLGAHFYCDLALVLLLLEARSSGGRRRAFAIAAFAVLALSSPTSWFLLPAAALLTWKDRKPHAPYLGTLVAVTALNGLVSVFVFPRHVREPPDLVYAPHIVVSKLLLWPLAGWRAATAYVDWVLRLDLGGVRSAALVALVGSTVLAGTFLRYSRRDETTLVLASTYATAVAGYLLFGLGVGRGHLGLFNAGRYAWFPNALLLLILANQLDFDRRQRPSPFQTIVAVALAAALVIGVSEFRYPRPVVTFARAPSWRAEVRHHRRDPNYTLLRIAPGGWVVVVPSNR